MFSLRRLFSPRARATAVFSAPLAPAEPFCAIGDIHGCDALLERMLECIKAEIPPPAPRLICVGDYVDRGEASAAVLRRLFALSRDSARGVTCLMGNH